MEQPGQPAASDMIDSLNSWWELAGVDAAVGSTPVNWLELDAKSEVTETVQVPLPQSAKSALSEPVRPAVDWPTDIETLKALITEGAELPGNTFGSRFVAPIGLSNSEVMFVSDLPDQDEIMAGKLGSGGSGVLLDRMMAAIGIKLADCYWTALATTIPSTGEIPETAHAELTDFVRHQMALIRPKSLILLGSAACKALLNEELMKARAQLRNFNHDGSNMAVLTTFHPRTLIARPAMKAQAWKDLQMFAKRDGL
jgi:uracil-DNA glycosylase